MLAFGALDIGNDQWIRQLGSGGSGQVWLAKHPRLGFIACKRWLSDSRDAAEHARRASFMARLSHPNIVAVFGFIPPSITSNECGLAIEFVRRGELQSCIKQLNSVEKSAVIVQLVAGLKYLHGRRPGVIQAI